MGSEDRRVIDRRFPSAPSLICMRAADWLRAPLLSCAPPPGLAVGPGARPRPPRPQRGARKHRETPRDPPGDPRNPPGTLRDPPGHGGAAAAEALGLSLPVELVLAEDGTAVDTEGFLGALPPHTPLVALGPGQRWEPPKAVTFGGQWEPPGARGGDEVARVTVALARAGPQDLVGRLRVTAAVRGLRCDVVGLGPERLLRELLRLLAATTRAVGQSLLNLSALLRRLLDSAPQRGRAYKH
ncbi:lipid transferase CIDEB isoform X1 [Anas acuta]|uniref:lipid transferase CIDEB isoform X1 n=1 Tax=Anas acuta TaxID=28680 RepID=UPI0035C92C93